MWEIFDKRLEDQTASVTRLVDRLSSLPAQARLEHLSGSIEQMDDSTLEQVRRVLQLRLHQAGVEGDATGQTRENALDELLNVVVEALARRAKRPLNANVPSPDKLRAYSELLEQYNEAMSAHSPARATESIATLEEALAESERLIISEPTDYLERDLAEFMADLRTTIADMYKTHGTIGQAKDYYESAIRSAEAYGLYPLADRVRLKLAELLFGRTGDFDRALHELLPLQQEIRDREPSLERVRITTLLAEAYVDIGDLFEAAKMWQEAEKDLSKLGYSPPDPESLEGTLSGWIETADRTTKKPNEFREALYRVLSSYMSIENMRSKKASSPDEQAAAMALIERMAHLNNKVMERDQEIFERDQSVLKSLALDPIGEATSEEAEMLVFAEEMMSLNRSIKAFRTRMAGKSSPPQQLLDEAAQLAEEARRLKTGRLVGILLDAKADLLLQLGQEEQALQVWREAYADSLDSGQLDDALYMLTRITHVYVGRQDHAATSDVCGEAIDLIERYRYNLSPAYQQSAFLQQKVHFYSLGVFSAYKLGDNRLILKRMELTKAWASLRWILQRVPETAPGTLETEIRRVNSELDNADDETATVLREKRRTLWDLQAIRRAEKHGQELPSEFSLHTVQEALEPDEAVVYYYWLQAGVLLVVALDKQEITVTRQILDEEYPGLVNLLEYLGKLISPMPKEVEKMLDKYGKLLLPESALNVLKGKKRVIFSPHRVLHLFPFHALRWKRRYLITRLAVTYAPNLASLLVRNPRSEAKAVLAIGTGHFHLPGYSLTALPGAVKEVDDIRQIYKKSGVAVEVLQGGDASVSRLREWADSGRFSSFHILHLATHGQDMLGDTPSETYLYLHDGRLEGMEIAGWHLNAELVVLSACHSGKRAFKGRGMSELPGDEMFGLQAAFLNAGARAVVGALWPADDNAAYDIMTKFHRNLAAGLQPELALQSAVRAYLRNARIDLLKNPYFWAPFFMSMVGRSEPQKAES